jgi:hypothetical protein
MTFAMRMFCGLALAIATTVTLSAKLVADATRTGNHLFTGVNQTIPLTNGGATTLTFSGKGRHLISYSAECETDGTWLSIEILVDGVAVAPTAGGSDAFCSDHNDNDSNDAWAVSHYRVATPNLASGNHTVQVRATVFGIASGWLGDSALLIEK